MLVTMMEVKNQLVVNFNSVPVNSTCDYPAQSDYEAAINNLTKQWNGIQTKLSKKYKAAGKAAPKLTKRSTNLLCPSVGTSNCSTKCDGYCAFTSKSDCNNSYDTDLCVLCFDSSSLWIYPLS